MRFHEFRVARRPDCAVCGNAPTITEPRDPAPLSTAAAASAVRRITAGALNELLREARAPAPRLVDVREVHEFSAGHLEGSVNIPLGELPRRLAEIARHDAPVFIS